jgi:excisionase family DNA binding protein
MSELWTIEETAEKLRIGRRTVERLLATGQMRSMKVGRRRLIAASEVDRLLRLAERRGRMA